MKILTKHFFVGILFLLFACESEIIEFPPPDPFYPTVYSALSAPEMAEKLNLLNEIKDTADVVELDQFGYVNVTSFFPDTFVFNAHNIRQLSFEKINRYSSFLGLNKLPYNEFQELFNFLFLVTAWDLKSSDDGDVDQSILEYWDYIEEILICSMRQKSFNNYVLEWSAIEISFLDDKKGMRIYGQWFSDIYIPENDAIKLDDALNIVIHDCYDKMPSGEFSFNIESMIQNSSKVIRIIDKNDGFEFRICWKVLYQGGYYYIDTQTSEILKGYRYSYL